LAKLLLTPSNFLLFDEPTNHLDMRSKDILKNALLQFTGTMVIVSHDRDFLQGLTSKVYEFRNKGIKEYRGDIFEYLEKRKLEDLKELEIKERKSNADSRPASDTKIKWEQKKEFDREKRKLEKKVTDLEQIAEKLELKLEAVNNKLADPSNHQEEIKSGALYKEHDELTKDIGHTYSEWEKFQLQLENMNFKE
jgi:ATP-binding cassette subfamily F protein 3